MAGLLFAEASLDGHVFLTLVWSKAQEGACLFSIRVGLKRGQGIDLITGNQQCTEEELARWKADEHRFPRTSIKKNIVCRRDPCGYQA